MSKIQPKTSLGALLIIVSFLTMYLGYYLAAPLFSILAFFAVFSEFKKYTGWYQYSVTLLSATQTGLCLDVMSGTSHFPFMSLALFIAAASFLFRFIFFRTFTFTRYDWFEATATVISLVIYVFGNLSGNYDWMGWLFPLPILIFAVLFARGSKKDHRQLLSSIKGGYKIKEGQPAGDFALPDQNNEITRLSDYKNERNVLLIFVRGDWCPGCHMMLRTYEKNNDKFKAKNVMVMAIGPDPVGVNREMVERLGLDFKVLADDGQRTAMSYGVQVKHFENPIADEYTEGLPLPASFLIDIHGVVRYVSRPDRVGEFLNPSLIFPILDRLK
jgi:peroxiredoxin